MTTSKKILALFPGQGSQKVGMGGDLVKNSDIANELFSRADKALDLSLSKLCLEGPMEQLTSTEIAQPAILTVSVISFEMARSAIDGAAEIVCGAGHSLGEYSALVATGALKFEDAVQLVNKRGRYMQEAVASGAGRMVAVLGREVADIEQAISQVTAGPAEIANINAPGQIVVSGSKEGIEQFTSILGGKIIELQVSAPFHCSLMRPAAESLAKDLDQISISSGTFPVISNVDAKATDTPQAIREALKRQVCGRVRWVESMQEAVKTYNPTCSVEFGFGNVLTGLMKRIDNSIPRIECGTNDQITALREALK